MMNRQSACLCTWFAVSVFIWLLATEAHALIVFDTNTSTDNSTNVITPGDSGTYPDGAAVGSPWQYVVRYGTNNASGVYLGNGYLLTARHVTVNNSALVINGVSYNRDTTFAPVSVVIPGSPDNSVVDLSLQKIVGDPGLAQLPIASPTAADTSQAVVLIGWGQGKGGAIANQGWSWGGAGTYAFRWGTNNTLNGSYLVNSYSLGGQQMNYNALATTFNSNKGSDEAAGAMGDSGSPLFQNIAGTWTLTGITVTVDTNGFSYYNPPDATYFVRLREYAWIFRYNHWKTHYNIAQATPDNDDTDGDGISLLAEYALGMDPTAASTDGLPVASIDGSNLALTYSRLITTTDIKVEIETSSSLAVDSWTVEPATTTTLTSSSVFRTLKSSVPLSPGVTKFARLKITKL